MEILDKKGIEDKLGKYGFFSGNAGQKLVDKIRYIGGIEKLDKVIDHYKTVPEKCPIYLDIRPKGLEIQILFGFESYRIGLLNEDINFVALEHQQEITIKKEKSIIGRALAGGLLLGPVGAVVGGMTGLGKSEVKLNEYDNILSMSVNVGSEEKLILFSCTNKNVIEVQKYLKEKFPGKYKLS